ncbi:MAG: hypothetical protein KF836_14085 [Fimbriimonadaceae bacterium]|nr:hypothetical protein [Fimbriimonadaceae bacterium]
MNPNKFKLILWSFMATRNKFWSARRNPKPLVIQEVEVLRNDSTDTQNIEFARKILTVMFANLKKRGRPVTKREEDKDAA